jgi:hypothetical protein
VERVDVEQQQSPSLLTVERVEDPLFYRFYKAVSVIETVAAVDRLPHLASEVPANFAWKTTLQKIR